MRSLTRLSALPVLLAAGALSAHATPILPSASVADYEQTSAAAPTTESAPVDGAAIAPATDARDDAPEPLRLEAATPDAAPDDAASGEESTGNGSLWLYALGGCSVVAIAAFRSH